MADALAALDGVGLNPSSQHAEGRRARGMIETARLAVATAAGADRESAIFMSGATEAANAVLAQGWDEVLLSSIEHDCVRAAAERSGATLVELPVATTGTLDWPAFEAAIATPRRGRRLVAVMAANNETGALQPVADVCARARETGAATLIDAAQALGKTGFAFDALGADFALLSGHKIGGPAGVGALLVRPGVDFQAALIGGGQEGRRRAGTENLIGVVGFGAAASAIDRDAWAASAAARDAFEARLRNRLNDLVFFAEDVHRLPNTSCVATPHWRAEMQLMQLDLAGVAVSAGSACSSGKLAASHVLRAMGADDALAGAAIRVSFGPGAAEEDGLEAASAYAALAEKQRARQRGGARI